MLRQFGILLLISLISFVASAQDTLPSFTLLNKGNKHIIISWRNPYDKTIHQLSVQRSFDSTKNFKSILTLPDPTVAENGYADINAPTEHMFYRLYILLDSGKYVFSKSKRPVYDTIKIKAVPKIIKVAKEPVSEEPKTALNDSSGTETKPALRDSAEEATKKEPEGLISSAALPKVKEPGKIEIAKPKTAKLKEIPERILYIKKRDTLIGQIAEHSIKRFKDSLATRSKDTFSLSAIDTIVIKPFVPKEVYVPSKYVFTEKDGNVKIVLPGAEEKKYTIKFFDEKNIPVLEIKQI